MFGIFDEIFDLNHDGKLDDLERAAEAAFVTNTIEEKSVNWESGDIEESDDFGVSEEPEAEEDDDEEEERLQALRDEIEDEGLDVDDLEFMDEDERTDALEEAGLDPDDYEELFF